MMTLWWANKLKSKDALQRGQGSHPAGQRARRRGQARRHARLPRGEIQGRRARRSSPPTGSTTGTSSSARSWSCRAPRAQDQGAEAQADPEADRHHRRRGRREHQLGGSVRPPETYNGGNFAWPTSSRHISQYYHYGHYGIDIDGSTGDRRRRRGSGTVTFAGWKNNGGGYQVWIAHGSGLYTTYNHMSSVSVGRGQHVGRASVSGAWARPASRPARTSTSRSGGPRSGTAAARQPAGLPLDLRPGARASASAERACERMTTMFLDRVKIWVRAGDGGDGAATFRQEAHVPRGGPDGGDGGRGGSVYLRVDAGQTTLRDFQYRHHFKATPGGRGTRARRHGKAGDDLILDVPPGTAVSTTSRAPARGPRRDGQEAMVARGGRGGLGNTHFKTATHQAPKHAQKGEPGEERWLRLELRLIADIGLVGLPNAGKSTLLAAVTAAQPKIADYPFTTLEPNLGVMDLDDEDDGARPSPTCPASSKGRRAGPASGTPSCATSSGPGSSSTSSMGRRATRSGTTRSSARSCGPTTRPCSRSRCSSSSTRSTCPLRRGLARLRRGAPGRGARGDRHRRRDRRGARHVPSPRRRAPALRSRSSRRRPSQPGVVVHRIDAMGDGFVGRARPRRRLPRPRQAHRADRRPDELRRRGVGRAVPARPGPDSASTPSCAGPASPPATWSGSAGPSSSGSRCRGRRDGERPRGATGVFGGRSTRSTRPPRGRRGGPRHVGLGACCSSRPGSRHTSRVGSSPRSRTGWRWSRRPSPAIRRSR